MSQERVTWLFGTAVASARLETPASRILTWRSVVEEVLGDVKIEGSLIALSDTLLGISGSTLKISLSVSSVAVSSVIVTSFGCGATCGKGADSGGTAVEVDAGAGGEGKGGARR